MNIQKNPNQQQKVVSLADQPNEACPICGCKHFRSVFVVKKVSALLSPTGKEENFAGEVLVCEGECGKEIYVIPSPAFQVIPLINQIAQG